MDFLLNYWYIALLLVLLGVTAYFLFFTPVRVESEAQSPWSEEQKTSFQSLDVDLSFDGLNYKDALGDQPDEWRDLMRKHGLRLSDANVDLIYFVNGTYAGSDPMDLIPLIRTLFPKIPLAVDKGIMWLSKKSLDSLVKDCGNFTDGYVELFESALQANIPCVNFKWSSGNHHAARLRGTADLIQDLAARIESGQITAQSRVLFIGHSHAGQLFSLVTQLFQKGIRKQLVSVVESLGVSVNDSVKATKAISKINFDFATLGMPPRYHWHLSERIRVVHLINHRGQTHQAGSYKGLLHTVDGDYIQQSGIRGTDTVNFVPKLRVANQKLNDILDGGINVKRWIGDIKLKNRVPRYGFSYLIDYKDMSYGKPNLFRTVFGHGTYTETRFMEFNLRIITNHFYR